MGTQAEPKTSNPLRIYIDIIERRLQTLNLTNVRLAIIFKWLKLSYFFTHYTSHMHIN